MRVDVRGEELGAVGVGARHQKRRDPGDVGREPRGDQGADELIRRHQDLAAQVAALLLRGELVLEVDSGGPRLDHPLHQLEGVEGPAEAGLGVGDDRGVPVPPGAAFGVLDLIGSLQRLVDSADESGNAVHGVETLVRVGAAVRVRVGGHLPAAAVDGVEPGAHLLDCLIAGDGPQRRNVILSVQELPQTLRAHLRQRMLDAHRAAQPPHVLGRIGPGDPVPADRHEIDLLRRGGRGAVALRGLGVRSRAGGRGLGSRFGLGAGFVHQIPPEFLADGRAAVKRS